MVAENIVASFTSASKEHYSDFGNLVGFYAINDDGSLMSQESFLKQIEFEDYLMRCKDC